MLPNLVALGLNHSSMTFKSKRDFIRKDEICIFVVTLLG